VKAGANSAITQYFYNADAYFQFVEQTQKLGLDVPVVAGIMPITNYTQLMRFSDMCGAEIPRWVRLKLASFGDDSASIKAFGLDVVSAVRTPAGRRRTGAALLQHESGSGHHGAVAAAGEVTALASRWPAP
jgi:hypothetical protein